VIALIQRVGEARVTVADDTVGAIGRGILAFVGVERGDSEARAQRLLERILGYRLFPDAEGRMNRSLRDVGGGLLLVSQFTLVADTKKGARPSFSSAASPEEGRRLFEHLVALARASHPDVATGRYGADMQVALVNDGPVTFWLTA
jgi:D-tyrosyl-tRNA(Tyr) deacylase